MATSGLPAVGKIVKLLWGGGSRSTVDWHVNVTFLVKRLLLPLFLLLLHPHSTLDISSNPRTVHLSNQIKSSGNKMSEKSHFVEFRIVNLKEWPKCQREQEGKC